MTIKSKIKRWASPLLKSFWAEIFYVPSKIMLCAMHRNEAQKTVIYVSHFFLDTQAVLTLKEPFGQVL